MKVILEKENNVEICDALDEKSFKIGDSSIIFDILRKKMYSNPILAVCREISCNAKDSHTESGKPDIPIQITLPSYIEPFYKIKDFGVGISPSRIADIYINYGSSTKRADNSLIGYFGMGSKTPFAVSDSFTVVTNYNGVKYNYACFIDETKVGKLITLSEGPTSDPNGTEVIIPVQSKDFDSFRKWTEYTVKYWKVKPIVKNGIINTSEPTKKFTGENWQIVAGDYDKKHKLIVGEIEYPLDVYALDTKVDWLSNIIGDVILFFNIGDLSLSANRETVYLDAPTKKKISDRLLKLKSEIKAQVELELSKQKTYFEANRIWHKEYRRQFYDSKFLYPLSWNGKQLWENNYLPVAANVVSFNKEVVYRRNKTLVITPVNPFRIRRTTGRNIYLEQDKILIHDIPSQEPTAAQIKSIFDKDAALKTIQVICIPEHLTFDKISSYGLEESNVEPISKYVTVKIIKPRSISTGTRLVVFKAESSAFRQCSYANIDEDVDTKILCILKKNFDGSRYIELDGKIISSFQLDSLKKKFPKHSFYGIDESISKERIKEDFSDLIPFKKWITDNVIESKDFNFVEVKYCLKGKNSTDVNMLTYYDKFKASITNSNSTFMKRLDVHRNIAKYSSDSTLLNIYESLYSIITEEEIKEFLISRPDLDINLVDKEYIEKYPLLSAISYYDYERNIKYISHYVNLVDKG